MPLENLDSALAQRKAFREYFGERAYIRLHDSLDDAPKGTVVLNETVIYGYPQIGRILRLETGLQEQFRHPFHVEEKVDGYNVRVIRYDGRHLALTRGGFICPFTTDRLPDLMNLAVFDEHPDLVVCAEVAGPDNPYLVGHPPYVSEDVRLFVFDLMRQNQPAFLDDGTKEAVVGRYGLNSVTRLGRFTANDWAALQDLVRRFNDEGREGIVLKEEAPGARRAKYVTSNSSIEDIAVTAENMLQLPGEYFTGRILRLVLFMDEERLIPDDGLYRRLGHGFLDGLFRAVEQFKREGKVFHTYRCRFRRRENAEGFVRFLKHALGHGHVVQRRLYEEAGYVVLEFDKDFPKMTGLLGHLMGGGMVFD